MGTHRMLRYVDIKDAHLVKLTVIIDREARGIMYLVASVRPSVCPTSHG